MPTSNSGKIDNGSKSFGTIDKTGEENWYELRRSEGKHCDENHVQRKERMYIKSY